MENTPERKNLQQHESQLEAAPKTKAKMKYAAPSLVEYGNLAKLTRGGAGPSAEGGMTPCL